MAIRKWTSFVLAILMLFPLLFTSCQSGGKGNVTTELPEQTTDSSITTTSMSFVPDEPEHTITLASNGASDYVIVRSENANSEEKNAVLEFRDLFLEVTGVKLRIVTDYTEPVEKEIIIGKTTRTDGNYSDRLIFTGQNGYLFWITQQKMVIAGNSVDGTINGIYSFFEDQFGCVIYSKTIKTVKEMKNVEISSNKSNLFIPGPDYRNEEYDMNSLMILGDDLVSYETNHQAHPELFILSGSSFTGSICLSSTTAVSIAAEDIQDALKTKERITVYHPKFSATCSCTECAKHSDVDNLILFMNAVTSKVHETDPYAEIALFVQTDETETPTVACKGFSVILSQDITFLNYDLKNSNYLVLNEKLRKWASVCDSIWLNVAYVGKIKDATYRDQIYIVPNLCQLQENLKYLADKHVTRIYEGGIEYPNEELRDIRQKMLKKLVCCPDANADEMLDAFLAESFGSIAGTMKDYLTFICGKVRSDSNPPVYKLTATGAIPMAGDHYFSESQLGSISSFRAQALKVAKTDEEKALIASYFPGAIFETWENYASAVLVLDFPEETNCKISMKMNSGKTTSGSSMFVTVDQETLGKVKTVKNQSNYELFTLTFSAGKHCIELKQRWGDYSLDASLLVEFTDATVPIHGSDSQLSDPNATEAAKKLYNYLKSLTGQKIILGHHSQFTDMGAVEEIHDITGEYPALIDFELLSYTNRATQADLDTDQSYKDEYLGNQGQVEVALQWAREKGGIVSYTWHWVSPFNGHGKSFYTENSDFNVTLAVVPGTDEYNAIIEDIDMIAEQLKKFQDAGIPVVWRPLHEPEGGWFWWGAKGASAYVKLWKIMYDRMVNYHGLHNLIWVWNVGSNFDAAWYPGNDYVDIASIDIYVPALDYGTMKGSYDKMVADCQKNGITKPISLAECGSIPNVEEMINSGTAWMYMMSFNGVTYYGTKTSEWEIYLQYHSPYSITLFDLPDEIRYWTK